MPPAFATGADAAGFAVWVNRGRIAAGAFVEYAGANCYSGHGGTEIDVLPTTAALAACAASCRATAACECFTYDAAASQCWRRTACKPDYFEQVGFVKLCLRVRA